MLKRREVSANKGYVNEYKKELRRVDEEVDPWTVKYSTFDLETGALIRAHYQQCRKHHFIQWADREATDEEMSRLQMQEFTALYLEPASAPNERPNYEAPISEIQLQSRNDMIQR